MRKVDTFEQFRSKKAGIAIVVILHLVGALGFMSPLSEWFVFLTPVNLIITAGMIWLDSKPNNTLGWPIALFIVLLGYIVEIVGIKTGALFGSYSYGEELGWKFFETPPIIGLNWLIVVWGSYSILINLPVPKYVRWLVVGMAATALDFIIEPVAIHFQWWEWNSDSVPLQNYLTWFLVSSVMALIFESYPLVSKPRLGQTVFVCQSLFFLVLLGFIRFWVG